jgi:RNA polymerase sigma-70 factor (sigma-E family)
MRRAFDPDFATFAGARLPSLMRFALAVSGDQATAEDLVQSALLKTALRWGSIRDKGNAEAYVRTSIVRAHVNTWNRLRRRETTVSQLPEHGLPDAALSRTEDRDQLWSALRGLPPRQRAVIVLRFLYDQTEAQTAEQLACSVGTVKSQNAKALATLRVLLDAPEALDDRA